MSGKQAGKGFTLLEVLVSMALFSIALVLILQLFSANLRNLSVSEDTMMASIKAEAQLREFLETVTVSEGTIETTSPEGNRIVARISESLKEKTDTLPMKLLDIEYRWTWVRNGQEKSIVLNTSKLVNKSQLEKPSGL